MRSLLFILSKKETQVPVHNNYLVKPFMKGWLVTTIFILLLLSACKNANEAVREVDMYNQSGDLVGTATLSEQADGVNIDLKIEGMSQGFHGIHVHEFPVCDQPDFKSAGNHLNPEGKEHGLMHPEGSHLGDLPNIEVDNDGSVEIELLLADATLLEGKNSLLKDKGTSLVITEEKDDGISQPAGNSGMRMICGEIKTNPEKDSTKSPTDPTEVNEEDEEEAS